MNYNQDQIDQEFYALIEKARKAGLVETANHFSKAQGMARINAIRFLSAVFILRKKQRRVKAMQAAAIWILVFVVLAIAEGWINVP
jgi:hypothetical protein